MHYRTKNLEQVFDDVIILTFVPKLQIVSLLVKHDAKTFVLTPGVDHIHALKNVDQIKVWVLAHEVSDQILEFSMELLN